MSFETRDSSYENVWTKARIMSAAARLVMILPLAIISYQSGDLMSVATAANSGVAISRVSFTPSVAAASTTSRPVASAVVSLNSSAPKSSSLT